MGLRQINHLYANRYGSPRKVTQMYTRTAAGLKPWISQWLVTDKVRPFTQPVPRTYVIRADLWNTQIEQYGGSTTVLSNGAFSLPGMTFDLLDQLPIGVNPNMIPFCTGDGVTPMYGESVQDTVDSVKIFDSSGVAHEIPSAYWATSSPDALEIINNRVYNGSLAFTVPVQNLGALMGIDLDFPARMEVTVTCQPNYALLLNFDTSVTSYDLGCCGSWLGGYHISSNVGSTAVYTIDSFYSGVSNGHYPMQIGFDSSYYECNAKVMVAVVQPKEDGSGWDIVNPLTSTYWSRSEYDYEADDLDTIMWYEPLGIKINIKNGEDLALGMTSEQRIAVFYARMPFHHGAYFNLQGDDSIVLSDISAEQDGSLSAVVYSNPETGISTGYIQGSGPMRDYTSSVRGDPSASPFAGETGLTSIVYKDGITHIGARAFEGCGLKNESDSDLWFELPSTVTSIGNRAFANCLSFTGVHMQGSVTVVGSAAFLGCTKLNDLYSISALTEIGDSAFSGTALEQITLEEACCKIGANAFKDCNKLWYLTIQHAADDELEIGLNAFLFGYNGATIKINAASIEEAEAKLAGTYDPAKTTIELL